MQRGVGKGSERGKGGAKIVAKKRGVAGMGMGFKKKAGK